MTEPDQSNNSANHQGGYTSFDFAQFVLSLDDPNENDPSPTPIADAFKDKDKLRNEYPPLKPEAKWKCPKEYLAAKEDTKTREELEVPEDHPRQWYFIQKYHIVCWFAYHKKGPKSQDKYCDDLASVVYNMIKDPAMRLWIAEVVGIDHETMSAALLNSVIALLKVIENMPVIQVNKSVINSKICAAIREKIPFDVVKDALDKRQKELKIKRQRFKRKCIVSMNP